MTSEMTQDEASAAVTNARILSMDIISTQIAQDLHGAYMLAAHKSGATLTVVAHEGETFTIRRASEVQRTRRGFEGVSVDPYLQVTPVNPGYVAVHLKKPQEATDHNAFYAALKSQEQQL